MEKFCISDEEAARAESAPFGPEGPIVITGAAAMSATFAALCSGRSSQWRATPSLSAAKPDGLCASPDVWPAVGYTIGREVILTGIATLSGAVGERILRLRFPLGSV